MRFLLLVLFIVSACANIPKQADNFAAQNQLKKRVFETSTFKILTYSRIANHAAPTRFYIEGDGFSWRTPNMPSHDPTPSNLLMLELAASDPSPNIVYLARPCQFELADPNCEEKFWTTGIYAPEAVTAINEVINSYLGNAELVGYSGGAAIAVLVAAQNEKVKSLRSIAGNLDSKEFITIHNLSPLTDSADMDFAISKLALLPQIHFVGSEDEVITPQIPASYMQKLGEPNCSKTKIIERANHIEGWKEIWQELLKIEPVCNTIALIKD